MAIKFEDIKQFAAVTLVCIGLAQLIAYGASSPGNTSLSKVALLSTAIQWTFFVVHGSGLVLGNKPTEILYDISGAITFASCITFSMYLRHGDLSKRQIFLNSAVIIWCSRLGSFLFSRIMVDGKDSRFDSIRDHVFRFWNFWTIQSLWVFLTACPAFILNDSLINVEKPLQYLDYIGIFMYVFGFIFETIADEQKKAFKHNPKNKNAFINTGLWRLSRHPNYFGEITLWFGVFLVSLGGIDRPGQYLGVISPIFITFLLTKVSGIPLLEKASDKHWGGDKAYIAYKNSVPILIPVIGRTGNAITGKTALA